MSGKHCNPTAAQCVEGKYCSDDRTRSIDPATGETDCAPYLCGADGVCAKNCTVSDHCAGGFLCVGSVCVGPSAGGDGGSGELSGGGGDERASRGNGRGRRAEMRRERPPRS